MTHAGCTAIIIGAALALVGMLAGQRYVTGIGAIVLGLGMLCMAVNSLRKGASHE